MSAIPDRTPVIIGVGQVSERPGEAGYLARSPMELAGDSLRAAIDDCGAAASDLAPAIDTIAAIRQFEISTPRAVAPFGRSNNPPRSIALRVGANPARAILEVVGGQGPQKLIGELAKDIAAGRSQVAAIAGSEAISTALSLTAKGDRPDWSETVEGELEDRGFGMKGLIDPTLIAHGAGLPIPGYALIENARRARLRMSVEDYRLEIARLFAPFTEVAAENPHSAAPTRRSAAELATVSERNRVVAEPYLRMTVARDQVNQAASIVLASAGAARALGVPEDRWVHIHGVATAKEASVLQRAELDRSPAAIASIKAALEVAAIGMDAVSLIDLYSCFAAPVFNVVDAFKIDATDPRRLTLTGGLPFFGGAGNNYSAHAVAEAVTRLRSQRDGFALVGANGGVMSKYATGVYSRQPADWSNTERYRSLSDQPAAVAVEDRFTGEAMIESYTVMPRREGTAALIAARNDDGARVVAIARPDDAAANAMLAAGDPFGKRVAIVAGENQNWFSCIHRLQGGEQT